MKKMKITFISSTIIALTLLLSAFTYSPTIETTPNWIASGDSVNLLVSHGHCSTPFSGKLNRLDVSLPVVNNHSNPLENLKLAFSIDPTSFTSCSSDEITKRITTPGLFMSGFNDDITFTSTRMFTRGIDWYEIIGDLTIKGVTQEVSFFATGIRNPQDQMASILTLEAQMDLHDFGIDYDRQTTGSSNEVPTRWMYMNFKIEFSESI